MTQFSVGDRVIIRYGKRSGKKAIVIKVQPAHVYEVKAEDGAILFFSGAGIEKDTAATAKA